MEKSTSFVDLVEMQGVEKTLQNIFAFKNRVIDHLQMNECIKDYLNLSSILKCCKANYTSIKNAKI